MYITSQRKPPKPLRAEKRSRKIDRAISKFNETEQKMEQMPLYKSGTSKLCRKTHIDIANKIQINMYATGLHEAGSSAIEHQIYQNFVVTL